MCVGLPEDWSQDHAGGTFGKAAFSMGGIFPAVEPNVQLVKGLFSDSLPPFLRMEVSTLKGQCESAGMHLSIEWFVLYSYFFAMRWIEVSLPH